MEYLSQSAIQATFEGTKLDIQNIGDFGYQDDEFVGLKKFGGWKDESIITRQTANPCDSYVFPEGTKILRVLSHDANELFTSHAHDYEDTSNYLNSIGVKAPKIIRPAGWLMFMEDIPGTTLDKLFLENSDPTAFNRTIESLVRLRALSEIYPDNNRVAFRRNLGSENYQAFLKPIFSLLFSNLGSGNFKDREKLIECMDSLRAQTTFLDSSGLTLRDSKPGNWIINDDEPYSIPIDFDTACMGPIEYDLVSLLCGIEFYLVDNVVNSGVKLYLDKYQSLTGIEVDEGLFLYNFYLLALVQNLRDLGRIQHAHPLARKYYSDCVPVILKNIDRSVQAMDEFYDLQEIIQKPGILKNYN